MKKEFRRLISALLVFVLLCSMLPAAALAADDGATKTATIRAESISAAPGQTVQIAVTVEDNPGILGGRLSIAFDRGLTLVDAAAGDAFSMLVMTKPGLFTSPCQFVWDGEKLEEGDIRDGVILTLTFEVSAEAVSGTTQGIYVTHREDDFIDGDLNKLTRNTVDGGVTVIDYLPGDVNRDGDVSTADIVTLRRYLAGNYDVSVRVPACDVDADASITPKDLILIRRFLAGGYDVELLPSPLPDEPETCKHVLEELAYQAPTCTEAGRVACWHCTSCDQYFEDAAGTLALDAGSALIPATGHTIVVDEAVEATYESTGLTEGSHCSVCSTVIVAQEVVPKLSKQEYTIQYMNDMVPSTDTRYYLQNDITDHFHYTSGVEKALPTPVLDKYTFIGWSDASGNLVGGDGKTLPKGTTGDIILYANWVSNRNMARKAAKLGEPVTFEDEENGLILFQYKIGTIENIPLYTTLNLQCANGLITTVSQTNQKAIKKTDAQSVSRAIAKETSSSATWTLSEDWNEVTSVSQTTLDELKISEEEAERLAKSNGSSYNVGKSYTNSSAVTNSSNSSIKLSGNQSHSTTTGTETGQNVGLSVDAGVEVGASAGIKDVAEVNTKYSLDVGAEYGNYGKNTATDTNSWSNTASIEGSRSHSSTATKSWNTNSSFTTSSNVSKEDSYSKTISMATSLENGKTVDTAAGGGKSESEEYGVKDQESTEYGSVLTFDNEDIETQYTSFSSNGETFGSYRMVMTTSADVYAIVGYDVASAEYFVYTYSVSNKETSEYLDYSRDGTFDDYECSVIPFEIPLEVNKYVNARITQSQGLEINTETGVVERYTPDPSWHDQIIYIPSYFRVELDNGEYRSIKVTGLAEGLFKDNTDIQAVSLSSFITEIPDSAFEGCSSLQIINCPGVTKIGNRAFNGCTSLTTFTVPYNITSVGKDAFTGVQQLIGYAATRETADAIAHSGANNIELNISRLSAEKNMQFNIGSIESFKLSGGGMTFEGLSLDSKANTTTLNGLTIVGGYSIPLTVSSAKLKLDRVTITSNSIGVLLANPEMELELNNICRISSGIGKALICNDLALTKTPSNVYTKLELTGNLLYSGTITGENYLSFTEGEKQPIAREEYDRYVNGVTITLDANGGYISAPGSTQETLKRAYGLAVGELPVATQSGYAFDGWYTQATGGEKITADYLLESGSALTFYAHWAADAYTVTFDANGGLGGPQAQTKYYNVDLTPSDAVPVRTGYSFAGWTYNGNTYQPGGTFTENVSCTLTAQWEVNYYTLTFNANGGDSTGLAEAAKQVTNFTAVGELPTATRDYYTFDGWYTSAEGGERVTAESVLPAANDVTLYAHWKLNAASGWVLKSEMPSDGQIVSEKWTYDQRTNTESKETSLSGYTQYGSYWVQSGTGSSNYADFPKGYDTGNSYYTSFMKSPYSASESATNKREVSNTWAGYVYWHWMYDCGSSSAGNRTIYDHKGTASYNNFYYKYFGAFTSTSGYKATSSSANYSCGSYGYSTYYNTGRTSYSQSQGTHYWYRFSYYTSTYKDYYKMFQYYKLEAKESQTAVTASDTISNVQNWVQYRPRTN